MSSPVSVIIPRRNDTNYLGVVPVALRRPNLLPEISVDGSTSGTEKRACSIGSKVLQHPAHGPAPRQERRPWPHPRGSVLRHDHDGVLRPGGVRHLLARLKDDTSLAGVMAQARAFVSQELAAAAAAFVPAPASFHCGTYGEQDHAV